jgi:hypothetical protein
MIDIAIPLLTNKLLKWRNKHIKRVRGHKEYLLYFIAIKHENNEKFIRMRK